MNDYIDRQELLKEMKSELAQCKDAVRHFTYDSAVECVEFMPAADVQKVVHGHWITEKNIRPNAYSLYHCSICKSLGNVFFDYCPYCGAIMDMDGDSNE